MKPSLKLIPALISGTLLSGFGLAAEKSPIIHYLPEAQDVVQNKNDAGAVLSWLRQHAKALGIDAVVDQLQLRQTKHSLTGTHYHFQQQINGIPVWRSEVVVSVIQSRTQKAASSIRVFNNSVAVSAEIPVAKSIIDQQQALALAWSNLQSSGDLLAAPKAEMAYLVRGKQLQLVYVTSMYLNQPYGEWQQLVDAKSGEVIAVERTDLPTFKNANSEAPDGKWRFAENKQARDFAQVMQAFQQRQAAKQAMAESAASKADATALVFDPDPRTTLNDATLEDNSPAARFEGAYQTRTLRDVTVQNGVYSLKGPWVTIENFEAGAQGSVETPSTTTDGNWTAKRGDSAFNDVMTYFHLDQNQRYIQSLGFSGTKGIQELSISVDANGVDGADNSHFIPSSNKLAFGWGCVDDNEDTDVILHEYGHAINYAINNYWSGGDTGAMGEGFGDYWAGSYSYSTPNGQSFNPNWVYTWDGHNSCWSGRVMNRTNYRYDPSVTYSAHMTVNNIRNYGDELWSTPLFQSLVQLMSMGESREGVDQIVLEAQFGLGAGLRMPQLAEATVAAALNLFPQGPHAQVFYSNFKQVEIIRDPVSLLASNLSNTGDNSVADPGETIGLTLPIKSKSPYTLTNVSATLSTSTPGVTLTNPSSGYPEVNFGQVENNLSLFDVVIPESHTCGVPVDLTLALNYEENGSSESQTFDVLLTTGTRSPVSKTEQPGVQIPDNSNVGVTDSLVLTDVGSVVDENFSVDLNITHPYVGDLTITLTSPSGTTIKLWDQEGGDSDNILGNFPRDFQPAQSFDAFQGESLSGTWTIKVEDGGAQDVGTLNAWTVTAGGLAHCANGEVENRAPNLVVANSNITVNEGDEVTLDASGSSDPENDAITFNWSQESGPSVTLNNSTTDTASFTAPQVSSNTQLEFRVTATDAKGASSSSIVSVSVTDTSAPDNGSSGNGGSGGGALWSLFGLLLLAGRRRRIG